MPEFVEVAKLEDLPREGGLEITLEGRRIGLFRAKGAVYAIGSECPHRGGPLHEGILHGGEITCPWHAWTFDLESGRCTFIEGLCVSTFPVQVRNGRVFVARGEG